MQATVEGNCLAVLIEVGTHDSAYALLLNTDDDPETGYRAWNWRESAGADYLIQSGQLQRHDPSDPAMPWKWRDPEPLTVQPTPHSLEFRIPLASIQSGSAATGISLGFMLVDASFNPTGQIPSGSSFAPLHGGRTPVASPSPDRSACKLHAPSGVASARPRSGISKGLIVPAYVPMNEIRSEMWTLLAAHDWPKALDLYGEKQVQGSDGSSEALLAQEFAWLSLVRGARKMHAAGLDFWVAVSGPSSGPLSNSSDWQLAARVWDDLRNQGGRIFGYVHTCRRPDELADLIEIDDVMAQIDAWATNYPALDGIWIDEFYPRYELFDVERAEAGRQAAPAGCDASVMAPSFPNGICAAPLDRSFLRADGCYDPGVQIEPAGGYYHALTSRIRSAYPWLRIIGNAGGHLYSNQLKYADLVDVLVSYEQSLDHAQSDWSRVKAQAPTATVREAALFHGTPASDMRDTLGFALKSRFTHVYATDLTLEGGNVWGDITSYLEDEVDYLLEHF